MEGGEDRMINYDDIIYVGSSKPLICRDGNEQYAKSMDLKFMTYQDLPKLDKDRDKIFIIIDISAGWTSPEDMDIVEDFLNKYRGFRNKNIAIRLVDQFEHQRTEEVYLRMQKLIIDKNVKLITAYDCDYYDLPVSLILPYPYLSEDETGKRLDERMAKIILTGADVKGIYPLREKLYSFADKSRYIDTLKHPGYSGKHWNTGLVGKSYMEHLSKYAFMAVTTCIENYTLLKYVECAECGCVPIGESTKMLNNNKWIKGSIINIPNSINSASEFDEWFKSKILDDKLLIKSAIYRKEMKKEFDKDQLKLKLLNFINS